MAFAMQHRKPQFLMNSCNPLQLRSRTSGKRGVAAMHFLSASGAGKAFGAVCGPGLCV